MVFNVFGKADRRLIIYTLLKYFTAAGNDVLLMTDNPQYKRLIDGGLSFGEFKNTYIFVDSEVNKETITDISYTSNDFDIIIYDGCITDDADIRIFIEGLVVDEYDAYLANSNECFKIQMGKKVGGIPFKGFQYLNAERIESYHQLIEIDPAITNKLAGFLAGPLAISERTFRKAVAKVK